MPYSVEENKGKFIFSWREILWNKTQNPKVRKLKTNRFA